MKARIIVSQIFAIPLTWASAEALTQMFGSTPFYISIGIWGIVSLFVLAQIK